VIRYLIIYIAYAVFLFVRGTLNGIIGEKIAYKMRQDVFSSFCLNDISFFDSRKTGELMSRLGSDISTIRWASSGNASILLRNILLLLGSFVLLFKISWKLTLVLLSIVPIYTILTILFGKLNKKLAKRYQDMLANNSVIAEECFSNIRTVKSFGSEYKEINLYNFYNDKIYRIGKTKAIADSSYFSMT